MQNPETAPRIVHRNAVASRGRNPFRVRNKTYLPLPRVEATLGLET
jgi:hypothetical protein